jgi:integrase
MRSHVVGTVKEYKTESAAWIAVDALRLTINQEALQNEVVAMTFKQVVEHYSKTELDMAVESERKTYKTKHVYDNNLQVHILPRWGVTGHHFRSSRALAGNIETGGQHESQTQVCYE